VWFQRSPSPYVGQIWTTTRTNDTGDFQPPARVFDLDVSPSSFEGEPKLSGSKAIYFVADKVGYQIFRAPLVNGAVSGPAELVAGLNDRLYQGYPVVGDDELIAFWAADVGGGNYEMLTASDDRRPVHQRDSAQRARIDRAGVSGLVVA
jgi:hypothetical protein